MTSQSIAMTAKAWYRSISTVPAASRTFRRPAWGMQIGSNSRNAQYPFFSRPICCHETLFWTLHCCLCCFSTHLQGRFCEKNEVAQGVERK